MYRFGELGLLGERGGGRERERNRERERIEKLAEYGFIITRLNCSVCTLLLS